MGTQSSNQQLTFMRKKDGILGYTIWECWQQVEGDEPFLLLRTGEATSGPLGPVLDPQKQDRYGHRAETPANSQEGC